LFHKLGEKIVSPSVNSSRQLIVTFQQQKLHVTMESIQTETLDF